MGYRNDSKQYEHTYANNWCLFIELLLRYLYREHLNLAIVKCRTINIFPTNRLLLKIRSEQGFYFFERRMLLVSFASIAVLKLSLQAALLESGGLMFIEFDILKKSFYLTWILYTYESHFFGTWPCTSRILSALLKLSNLNSRSWRLNIGV